jgi:hypothetical protein
MTLSAGSGPRAAAGFRDRVALVGAFLVGFFAAAIPKRLRVQPQARIEEMTSR